MNPRRDTQTNPRAKRTNTRAKGTNPRAMGTNRSAGTAPDLLRVARTKRRALARYRVRVGAWCVACDDTGWVSVEHERHTSQPCPCHREMTAREAELILSDLMDEP